ncbi:helix-turn-helix transcriptional regulator [Komagataeibacter rhaeticus]|uniref:helix-turn-helix transcriptional regulator n=1 Tax=Komagataeibacter rhaeticus TaxID=215221 RepID=UPI0027D312E9|nr:AlpA family transcriptional regulator [Komagataeibacter rhaeticus]
MASPFIPGSPADIRNTKQIDPNRQDMEDLNMDATEYKPDNRLLRLREVTERTGLSRATIYRHINKGTFPKPRKLSSGTIRWHSGIIENWINTDGTPGN